MRQRRAASCHEPVVARDGATTCASYCAAKAVVSGAAQSASICSPSSNYAGLPESLILACTASQASCSLLECSGEPALSHHEMRARLQQFVVNDRTAQRKKTAAAPRHLQALATTEDEQQTLDAVRDYVCAGGPDAAEFAFARAHHYFELNRFAEAGILFDAIALGDAAGDFAQGARRSAAMLALESMNTIGSEQGRPACYEAIALHAQLYVAKLCVGVAGETSDDHDCRILRRVLGPLKHAPGCTLEIKAQSSP